MSSRFTIYYVLLLIVFPGISGSAQKKSDLQLITYRQKDRILLRWAPTSATLWLQMNEEGYSLYRFTIIRDSVRVYPPEKVLVGGSFKPAEVGEWEKASIDNKYAAIAAQAIYGDTFMASTQQGQGSVLRMIQLSTEQEMRYSFALLSADQSFEVAELAGLGFSDYEINDNEVYLYKLFAKGGLLESDTAYSYVELYDAAPLPTILDVKADFKDKAVTLNWRKDYYDNIYSSYLVEKSTDGKNYTLLNDLPSITTSPVKNESNKWMGKTDSLVQNDKIYYYRVRGRTPFGIVGPPSNVVSGSGRDDFDISLAINDGKLLNNSVILDWSVSGTNSNLVDKIYVERSSNSINFLVLDTITSKNKQYKDESPLESNYYRIVAEDASGNRMSSLPYFVQKEDSIPPSVPLGFTGVADTTGLVTLSWQPNNEQDVAGYRVFRSRIQDSEYRQVTIKSTKDTVYQDWVDLGTLSKKMYYKVLAVDNRGNNSALSEDILVELPDIIPPVPPRITGYKLDGSKVSISWRNSSSKDVLDTKIMRVLNDTIINLTDIPFESAIEKYTDSTSAKGVVAYFLLAVDESGNISEKSNIIRVEKKAGEEVGRILLSARADRRNNVINLSWSYTHTGQEFRLYKAKGEDLISLYKVFPEGVKAFRDDKLEINSVYHYRVQVIDLDSGGMVFSEQIKLKY